MKIIDQDQSESESESESESKKTLKWPKRYKELAVRRPKSQIDENNIV